MFDVLVHSWRVYSKYLSTVVLFFSLPFIISLLIPLLSPAPTFSALGGSFLRSGSLPSLQAMDMVIVVVATLISLIMLSLALVAINLVVKTNRTKTRVSTETMKNLGRYTVTVLSMFIAFKIIETLILSFTLSANLTELPVLVFSFLASLGLFYAAPAIVLEEKKPVPAFVSSYHHLLRKPQYFILWLVLAAVLVLLTSTISFSLFEEGVYRQGAMVLLNSLIVMPFLLILQAQSYLAKYTILSD